MFLVWRGRLRWGGKYKTKKIPELPRAVSSWTFRLSGPQVPSKVGDIPTVVRKRHDLELKQSVCAVHSSLTYQHLDAVNIPGCWCTHQHTTSVAVQIVCYTCVWNCVASRTKHDHRKLEWLVFFKFLFLFLFLYKVCVLHYIQVRMQTLNFKGSVAPFCWGGVFGFDCITLNFESEY